MDSEPVDTPSLLVHFPNLKSWCFWNSSDTLEVKIEELRDEVTRCCPLLKTLLVETAANITARVLVKGFNSLTSICILNKNLSAEVVLAILNHQDTLLDAFTFTSCSNFFDSDDIPEVESNHLQVPDWVIQSIPRCCTRLENLQFHLYEMNINDIEEATWGCYSLETLYIRIHGLNTKEKIDRAIQLWIEGRIAIRKKRTNDKETPTPSDSQLYSVIPRADNSIEARVARHLLKFKKLHQVWLGWKIRNVRN
ncbi:hypothetical protein BGZ65_011987 [Modicella reniformis]|uniref:Uncharacterized protein n=1 Tax=Modicella reniformis TaxID=1440133 RepID=A0A9P6JFJ9_9FUNG|nr:hypothetical protein BGZ65_011987 [Modicella reniformis]